MSVGRTDSPGDKAGALELAARAVSVKGLRRLLLWATAGYLALLVGGLAFLEWEGGQNWLTSLALFAPPQVFLAPLLVLMPASVWLSRRLLVWQLAGVVLVGFGFMTFRWGPARVTGGAGFGLITHNAGQGNLEQLAHFVAQEAPDAVLLQDCAARAGVFRRRFPEFAVEGRGEFLLLSRHPIVRAELLDQGSFGGRTVAARFEIIYRGRPLALYNVHLPTPRRPLSGILGGGVAKGWVARPSRPGKDTDYRHWVEEHAAGVHGVLKVLEKEREPFMVGGDFNLPDHGHFYHLLAGSMSDAFAKTGRGWGLTFPGQSSQALTFFGPWLRIDYLFSGRGWEPASCKVDSGSRSQHRPVSACFLSTASPKQ